MTKIIPLLFLLAVAVASAESLPFSGVLGNSGEQGLSLARFGPKTIRGLGVVVDKFGSLWDRGGDGVLNRYAVDGRQIATYPIPASTSNSDRITLVGDRVVLLVKGKIYTLPVEAPSGTKPDDTRIAADGISAGQMNGKLAVLQDGKMSLWEVSTGKLEPFWKDPVADMRDFDLTPDGGIAFKIKGDTFFLPKGSSAASAGVPKPSPGSPIQFLDHYWYGFAYHGTARRFNADFEADPGVILGGGSGSFIGHVDQVAEIGFACGIAKIGNDSFALSGSRCVLHLLHWNEGRKQMEAVRRIGAIPICQGLALNRKGDVWYNSGLWKWSDRPESPQQNCTVAVETGQAVMLPTDVFVAACARNGTSLMTGNFTWNADFVPLKDALATLGQAAAVYPENNGLALLLADAKGKGRAFKISRTGQLQSELGPVELIPASPVKEWTSLATKDKDTLLAAADGSVVELQRDGKNWKESRRWNSWGTDDASRFGSRIFITADDNRLWVSDTKRHRVLVFALDSGAPIAAYGLPDQAGDSLASLNEPQTLAARERRAVVFDSGNQRLVKLTLQ